MCDGARPSFKCGASRVLSFFFLCATCLASHVAAPRKVFINTKTILPTRAAEDCKITPSHMNKVDSHSVVWHEMWNNARIITVYVNMCVLSLTWSSYAPLHDMFPHLMRAYRIHLHVHKIRALETS